MQYGRTPHQKIRLLSQICNNKEYNKRVRGLDISRDRQTRC